MLQEKKHLLVETNSKLAPEKKWFEQENVFLAVLKGVFSEARFVLGVSPRIQHLEGKTLRPVRCKNTLRLLTFCLVPGTLNNQVLMIVPVR